MKLFLKHNFDILYIVLAVGLFIVDLLTRTRFFEGATFLIIFAGFAFISFNIINYPKDERINYIAFLSGYYSFMVSLIIISVFSFSYRFFSFPILLPDALRYFLMIMWILFSLIYSIAKRKI